MIRCQGPNCTTIVTQRGVGRPPRFCSDLCRARTHRLAERHAVVIEAATALQSSPEAAVIRALAALDTPSLVRVLENLQRAI